MSTEQKAHNLCASSLVYSFYGRIEPPGLTLDIFWRGWVNWNSLITSNKTKQCTHINACTATHILPCPTALAVKYLQTIQIVNN